MELVVMELQKKRKENLPVVQRETYLQNAFIAAHEEHEISWYRSMALALISRTTTSNADFSVCHPTL
jgi:hypothetical protein